VSMRNATLYVKVNGRDIPVSPCTVSTDPRDPGVFVVEERHQKAMREGKTVTFRRIGTLPQDALYDATNLGDT
jgi:hypothetical protein